MVSRGSWLLGMACALIPDVDVIGFHFGVHYGDLLGHRGITHSLLFAAVLSVLIAIGAGSRRSDRAHTKTLVLYLFVVYGHLVPGGNKRAVDQLDDVPGATGRNLEGGRG